MRALSKSPFLAWRYSFGLALTLVAGSLVLGPNGSADEALATTDQATSQIVSGEAFLAGKYVEVGVRSGGSFGSSRAAPAGFHDTNSQLGFVAIREKTFDSWLAAGSANKVDGDFFVPGTPYEGWVLRVGSSQAANNHSGTGIAGALSNLISGSSHSVDWNSSSSYQGLEISKTYSVPDSGQSLDISVQLTNSTGATITDIYYGRGVDPDDANAASTYSNTQSVEAQFPDDGYSFVKAVTDSGGQIGLFSTDSRARVAREGSSFDTSFNPSAVWSGTGDFNSSGSATGDNGMNLAVKIASLEAGASTTFSFSYLLTAEAAAEAVAAATSGLDNVTASGGDLTYEFSADGDTYWMVVADGAAAPTAAQVKAGVDYGGETAEAAGSGAVEADVEEIFAITGLSESSDYVVYTTTEYDDDSDSGTPDVLSGVESTSFSTAPGAPAIASVTPGDGEVAVAISASNSADNFEYSTDGGSTWTSRSPASTASPWTISSLTNGTSYSFLFRSVYESNSGAAASAVSATPVAAPSNSSAPSISGSVTSGQTLTASDGTWSAEGASITATAYQWISTSGGVDSNIAGATSQTLCVPSSLVGATLKVSVTKTNSAGSTTATSTATSAVSRGSTCPVPGSASDDDDDDEPAPVVSPSSGGETPVVIPRRAVTPPQNELPVTRQGPVLRNGMVPRDVRRPEIVLGGRTTTVETDVPDPSTLSVRSGVLSLGVKVQQDQGSVSESTDGTTEIAVRKGARASLEGSGFRPQSTVQVFLPLQGSNAKELTRIPVGADGSFSGDAAFATAPAEEPLPVGRQVLQLVSVDENGDEVVVNMTVNIAQPPPAPEFNRVEGVIPTQAPGTSIATNGGVPEQVTVSAVEDQKLAVVEGDGWSMAIGVTAEDGSVEGTDGGASIKLVRDQSARVSGDGFMPGTRADVWLFSEPTLLGTVTIDDEGRFDGEVNIDGRVIAVGEHTLQLQGVGEDGYVRAANMGVVVDDPTVAGVEDTAENSLIFIWWIVAAVVTLVLAFTLWVAAGRRRRAA